MMATDALIVIDLAFGDCGKGTIIDYLARTTGARAVVRFNGGPQAGHNVVTPDGKHHCFSQFASGTFVSGVKTILSRFMLIEPYALLNEAAHLRELGVGDVWDRIKIDSRCLIITPAHEAANRLREKSRGKLAHGTCGRGIGEIMTDAESHPRLLLRASELADRTTVARKLTKISQLKHAQLSQVMPESDDVNWQTLSDPRWIETAVEKYTAVAERTEIMTEQSEKSELRAAGVLLFEGAQGVLLDENFGFHPHTTWSVTTTANADHLLDECGFTGSRRRIGVLRSYFTRHGPGPLPTEDPALRALLPEPHNIDIVAQGAFRVGIFDCVLARYAIRVAPVDELAMTHLDRVQKLPPRICVAYRSDNAADAYLTDLPGKKAEDFQQREKLTHRLSKCEAVYEKLPANDRSQLISRIELELGVKVRIRSDGPAWTDKTESVG
jgi:adenylosuccinate synthase